MPKDLILNSLEIRRFRCFRELRIEHLGRVNLIVGKNNVGKSTILEALRLFARPASFQDVVEIFKTRDEIANLDVPFGEYEVDDLPFGRLFFGRTVSVASDPTTIGPMDSPNEKLSIWMESGLNWQDNVDQSYVDIHRNEVAKLNLPMAFMIDADVQLLAPSRPALYKIHRANGPQATPAATLEPVLGTLRVIPCEIVGPEGLTSVDVERLWDDVSLSPLKQEVITAMRMVSPEVEDAALRSPSVFPRPATSRFSRDRRIPYVRIDGFSAAIPLRALGDGVNHLFGIALALVHSKDGLLLVDEIENGIHYSVQPDLWRLVFETAARLNVQVFATTHSYDCIKAFEQAASESDEEGILVRLARKGDRTLVGEFDERELEIAVEGAIEVR
jgi:energy-coupling factor transporter ATP-binding protein EcfA2